MPAIFSIFSISKWLGVFPFERGGVSKGWLLFSCFAMFGYLMVALHNLYSTPLFERRLHFYVQKTLLALVHLPLPLHLYRITYYENFYSHMSSIISEIPLYIDCGVPALLLISKSLLIGISPMKLMSLNTLLVLASYTLHILNAQYIVFINSKTRQIKKLRNQVDNYPISSCINLHIISSSVEEIHKIFAPQLLVTTVAVIGNAVLYSYITCLTYHHFLLPILFQLAAFENLLLAFSIIWHCSVFESEVKAFYADLFRVVWERDLFSNKKLVLYLLTQKKVKFSACGFFTFGCPLFTSIIAAVASYLVVLIQFNY